MKKFVKKSLSLLLCVSMLLGMMSTLTFAATSITKVELTGLDAPIVGKTPDFTVATNLNGIVANVSWCVFNDQGLGTSINSSTVFEAGKQYGCRIEIDVDAGTFLFPYTTTGVGIRKTNVYTGSVTVNGVSPSSVYVENDGAHLGVTVWWGKNALQAYNTVSITDLEPAVVGNTPDFDVTLDNGCTATVEWYKFTNGLGKKMASTDKFEDGGKYGCRVTLATEDGYIFPSYFYMNDMEDIEGDYKGTVMVNEETIDTAFPYEGGAKLACNLWWGKEALTPINNITISGIEAPVVGHHPDFICYAEGGSYSVDWFYFVDGVGKAMTAADTFEAGKDYGCEVTLTALDGCIYPSTRVRNYHGYVSYHYSGTILVNGSTPEAAYVIDNGKTLYTNLWWGKEAKSHVCEYVTTITPATTYQGGSVVVACSICGDVQSNESLSKIWSVSLSYSSCSYSGKTKTPTVTVKAYDGTILKKSVDYDVVYDSGRKNVGTYDVTINFKGLYAGTTTYFFKIRPKTVSLKVTPGSKKMTVKASTKVSATGGSTYQIGYRVKGTNSWKYVTTTSQTKTISNLKKGKTYEVKIRAYKTVSGKKYYGSWTGTYAKIK